jgi:hypothetical protein
MRRFPVLRSIPIFLALIFVSACSSSGTIEVLQSKTSAIPPGTIVALNITSSSDDETREAAHRLSGELFGRLVSEGLFKQAVQPEQPAHYDLNVQVGDVREVSQAASILFGVFAGVTKLLASVSLYDRASGQLVTAFDVEAESASHPLSSEAGIEDAVREAATKIIFALR